MTATHALGHVWEFVFPLRTVLYLLRFEKFRISVLSRDTRTNSFCVSRDRRMKRQKKFITSKGDEKRPDTVKRKEIKTSIRAMRAVAVGIKLHAPRQSTPEWKKNGKNHEQEHVESLLFQILELLTGRRAHCTPTSANNSILFILMTRSELWVTVTATASGGRRRIVSNEHEEQWCTVQAENYYSYSCEHRERNAKAKVKQKPFPIFVSASYVRLRFIPFVQCASCGWSVFDTLQINVYLKQFRFHSACDSVRCSHSFLYFSHFALLSSSPASSSSEKAISIYTQSNTHERKKKEK